MLTQLEVLTMLKKLSFMALMLLFAVGIAVAQDNPSSTPQASDPAQSNMVSGSIQKIDMTLHKITIKPEGQTETKEITFDDSTTVWAKEKAAKIDSLKTGDNVSVELNASNVATKISVLPKVK
jgi:Cu/Ag efflux protein CusF